MLSRLKLLAVFALAITICVTQADQKNLSEATSDLEIQEIHGLVDDCCCNAESIDKFNNDNIHYILEQLTTVISFFKYFKVDIYRDCPFWAEQQLCSIKAGGGCGACICDEKEVPFHILERDRREKLDVVKEEVKFKEVKKWRDREKDIWIKMDKQRDMVYLDLTKNPERFTGYDGYNATRIWRAIYMENCFHPKNNKGLCFEERVFYRLISGLHGSTTAHIAELYYMDGKWQPNMEYYAKNLGIWPDRIKNIYFTYLFLLRAVKKAQHQILEYDFKTGNVTEDTYGELLLKNLIAEPLLCNPTFDETRMFSNPESYKLRDEFKEKFRNISELMDCVTCETCKIHAKLQILGIATALKILTCKDMKYLSLERNEIIALINTLFKFSESITIHHVMKIRLHTQNMEREHQKQHESMVNPGSTLIPTQGKETILFLSGILISLFIIIYSFFIIKSNPRTKISLKKTNKTNPKKN